MVQFVELDSQEVDGERFGFFESSTKYQKTATSALKKALEMPLVAPVMGCTSVKWCHIWVEIMLALGIDMTAVPFGPICRAPKSTGGFYERPTTSVEIAEFLQLEGQD